MSFNSFEFAVFVPIIFFLYWWVAGKNSKTQNALLLFASYIFYGWWDARFLLLLAALSTADYFIGIMIDNNGIAKARRAWLIAGLVINIGALGVFKYSGFFINSFIDLISLTGYNLPRYTIRMILPLGISFYVFISLSYLLDIYRKKLPAGRNIVEVLLALNFFPIMLAGPIQRPSLLLPQIVNRREFDYGLAVDGLRQILWGLFAKVIIADNFSSIVDDIFGHHAEYAGSTLAFGILFFTIQIYADFSGYSNIAIGVAKLFGLNLVRNFDYPYFSRNIRQFWQRWHISLTTWFRDYVFLPIAYALSRRIDSEKVLIFRTDQLIYVVASLATWFLTGLWHGANHTFILWGMMNGCFLILYHLQMNPRKRVLNRIGINNRNPLIVAAETLVTFSFIMVSWVLFRSDSVKQGFFYVRKVFSASLLTVPQFRSNKLALITLILSGVLFIVEWLGRDHQHGLAELGTRWARPFRWALYNVLVLAILYFAGRPQQFIYFRF
jgi:alginate O-acetyltransferase complex protein AlgI